jgi:hypothetical protein
MAQSEFERGYRTALRHVISLQHQHWPDEAKPSIRKYIAQIKNCLIKSACEAEAREDRMRELLGKRKVKR